MDRPASRANQSGAPLMFIQADPTTFRELVQRLTGPSDEARQSLSASPSAEFDDAPRKSVGVKKPLFKLHERRQGTKLEIKPDVQLGKGALDLNQRTSLSYPGFPSPPCVPEVTPFVKPFGSSFADGEHDIAAAALVESPSISPGEEEKAISERRFYLHPSPRSRPGFIEPELLTLFPLTSPKAKES